MHSKLSRSHDNVLSKLRDIPILAPTITGANGWTLKDALLHLYVVDSEVLRNLEELCSGESLQPELLSRDDNAEWFRKSRERMQDVSLGEILIKVGYVRAALIHYLTSQVPYELVNDPRIEYLVNFSICADEKVAACLSGLG